MTGPKIGTTLARVEAAEQALGVSLPGPLRQALSIANRLPFECADETWELHPVWDPDNPRRTANHLVRENAPEQRWPSMGDDLLVIAAHVNTADRLVLRIVDGVVGSEILLYDTSTNAVSDTEMDVHTLFDRAGAYAREVQRRAARRRR